MIKERARLGQPQFIENLVKKCGKQVKNVHSHKTPGVPKFLIVRPMIKSDISAEDKNEYQLGMGMLMYLVKDQTLPT